MHYGVKQTRASECLLVEKTYLLLVVHQLATIWARNLIDDNFPSKTASDARNNLLELASVVFPHAGGSCLHRASLLVKALITAQLSRSRCASIITEIALKARGTYLFAYFRWYSAVIWALLLDTVIYERYALCSIPCAAVDLRQEATIEV